MLVGSVPPPPPSRPTVGISAPVSHPKLRFLTCFSVASQSGSGVTRPHSTNTHNAKVQTINLAKQQNLIRFVQQPHESKASVILCVMNGRCCASVPDVCMCRGLPPSQPPHCHNTCSRSAIVSPLHVFSFPLRQLHGAAATPTASAHVARWNVSSIHIYFYSYPD